jgi:hypothetical protein
VGTVLAAAAEGCRPVGTCQRQQFGDIQCQRCCQEHQHCAHCPAGKYRGLFQFDYREGGGETNWLVSIFRDASCLQWQVDQVVCH